MKLRNTLFLLVAAALVFGYIIWWERKQPGTGDVPVGQILDFDRDKVSKITLTNATATIVIKQVAPRDWRIEEPVKDRADAGVMDALCTSLEILRSISTLDGKAEREKLKEFGLTKGEASVKFTGENGTTELLVGKETPMENQIYAKLENGGTVYVVSKAIKDQIVKKPDDFRDRKLSDLTTQQVTRLVLKTAAGELEAEKKNEHWSLLRPLKARADDQTMNDLIAAATSARIDSFVSDIQDADAYGLSEPRATLTMNAEGVKEPIVLQIGGHPKAAIEMKEDKKEDPAASPASELTYVKLSTRDTVVTVPKSIEKLLTTQPNDLRDKHILRVNTDIVDRMTIESGREKLVLARKGEGWVRKTADKAEVPINGPAADVLLKNLVNVKVKRFVADSAGDLAAQGLAPATVRVTLSSYSGENTAETTAGEKPITTLLLGKLENDIAYAKLDEEPYVVAVPKSIFEQVWTDPLQWQELSIFDSKPEDLTSFEVIRAGQPALTFARDGKNGWKLTKGDAAVNQSNVQSLLNTLAKLRAVRWIGPTIPAHGFDKPTLTLSFISSDKKTGRVVIGGATRDDKFYATAEGRTGTFVVHKPDFDALQSTLVQAAKPAAPSSPGVASDAINPASTDGNSPDVATPLNESNVSPVPDSPAPTEAPAGLTKPAP